MARQPDPAIAARVAAKWRMHRRFAPVHWSLGRVLDELEADVSACTSETAAAPEPDQPRLSAQRGLEVARGRLNHAARTFTLGGPSDRYERELHAAGAALAVASLRAMQTAAPTDARATAIAELEEVIARTRGGT